MGKLERIYWGIDSRISPILQEMENTGVLIDWRWLTEVEQKLIRQKREIQDRIEQFLGWPLNPNSPPQVADALFSDPPDGLGLPTAGLPIGKLGMPSTSDKVIKHFSRFHPLVSDILQWRSHDTVLGGFAKKLIKLATESSDNRIHSHFNQTRTVIGRLACIAEGTPVEIVRDVSKYPEGVPIEDVKPGDLAYTYDDDLNLTLRPVVKSWRTGHKKVVRVHWRKHGNGRSTSGYVDLTPDHPVRLISGNYRKAEELRPKDRALALSRRINDSGYADLYATKAGRIGREHRFVFEQTGGTLKSGSVIHHIDGNKLNNLRENLEQQPRRKHARSHAKAQWLGLTEDEKQAGVDRLNKSWDCAERKERHREQMREAWRQGKFKKPQGDKHPPYEEITTGWLETVFDECGSAYRVCKDYGMNYYRLKEAMDRLQFVPGNHIIVRVEELDQSVDVYDLEIEGTHNFIAGELCVHNSSDPINLQNQPRDKNLIRKSFCAYLPTNKKPEVVLIGGDYSQIELRVASHLAIEHNMIEVYQMGGVCLAENNGPCNRFTWYECEESDCSFCGPLPGNQFPHPNPSCPKCGSKKVEHQGRCRHVDLHQRTPKDCGRRAGQAEPAREELCCGWIVDLDRTRSSGDRRDRRRARPAQEGYRYCVR
jgi:hypothetical protein